MIIYEDLLNVPFLLGGRTHEGMDCYGLVLELTRRNGTPLKDLNSINVSEEQTKRLAHELNVIEITESEIKEGDIVQCLWAGECHIGFILENKNVIHATNKGVRISPLLALINKKYYRVTK